MLNKASLTNMFKGLRRPVAADNGLVEMVTSARIQSRDTDDSAEVERPRSGDQRGESPSPEESEILRLIELAGIDLEEIRTGTDAVVFHMYMSQDKFKTALNIMPKQVPLETIEVLLEMKCINHLSDLPSNGRFYGIGKSFANKYRLWVVNVGKSDIPRVDKLLTTLVDAIEENEKYLARQKSSAELLEQIVERGSVL